MPNTLVYHVLPAIRGWKVHLEGASRAMSLHPTKTDAVILARQLAGSRHQFVVHDEDGVVEHQSRVA